MELSQAPGIINLTAPDEVQSLADLLSPDLIQQAFSLTDTVTLRKRKLPLESMLRLVTGMAIFNNRPLSQIVNLMEIVDRTGRTFTAPGSVIARRKTPGEDAVRVLFDLTRRHWHEAAKHPFWHGLTLNAVDGIVWRTPDTPENAEAFGKAASAVPATGFTLEAFQDSNGTLSDRSSAVFAGQQQVWYLNADEEPNTGTPAFPPRQAFTESAVLDDETVTALTENISTDQVSQAGYVQTAYLFPDDSEADRMLWSARQGYVNYATAEHFWLPEAHRPTLLIGQTAFKRDPYDCVITQVTDAAGLSTTAEYDWRFLTPVRITDVNDNVSEVTLDALGRMTALRFRGTEDGQATGYSDKDFTLPDNAAEALALTAPLPVAQCVVYVADSWMQAEADKLPPHVVTLATDRYDSDMAQQIRQQVMFSDGFGRVLQAATRQAEGEAWQREDDGSLKAGADGAPVTAQTYTRWAVTGRTEYDNKGQPVRTYQPYFLNSWKYVSDDSARQDLYADTHFYDPAGREYQVKTAKSWLRRGLWSARMRTIR